MSQSSLERPNTSDIGEWPRRLLHVQSMTSYEWQPGNIYGEHCSPAYNVVSYTWGRFMLGDLVRPDVQSIEVKGIDWKIPRIAPEHFSQEEFRSVIARAARIPEDDPPKDCNDDGMPSHSFIWVDVACIDQNFPPWADQEIGRQASIFKNAKAAYIWLSRTTCDKLTPLLSRIRSAGLSVVLHQGSNIST